jgi:hypothetical protein
MTKSLDNSNVATEHGLLNRPHLKMIIPFGSKEKSSQNGNTQTGFGHCHGRRHPGNLITRLHNMAD